MTFLGGLLLYAGLLVAAAGVASLLKPIRFLGIRTRRRVALVLALAFALFTAGVYLPCPATRVAAVRSHLDEFQPVYQFGEVHSVLIHAPAARVWTAMHEVTPDEITFFRTLMWLRFFHAPDPRRPILEGFVRGSFLLLTDDPPRELVFGKTGDGRHRSASTAAEFQAFPSPQNQDCRELPPPGDRSRPVPSDHGNSRLCRRCGATPRLRRLLAHDLSGKFSDSPHVAAGNSQPGGSGNAAIHVEWRAANAGYQPGAQHLSARFRQHDSLLRLPGSRNATITVHGRLSAGSGTIGGLAENLADDGSRNLQNSRYLNPVFRSIDPQHPD